MKLTPAKTSHSEYYTFCYVVWENENSRVRAKAKKNDLRSYGFVKLQLKWNNSSRFFFFHGSYETESSDYEVFEVV